LLSIINLPTVFAETVALDTENQVEAQKEPINTDVYIEQAAQKIKNEEYDGALRLLNRAIESNQDNPALLGFQGTVHYYLGNYEESISAFENALNIDPNNADFHLLLGIVYDSANNAQRARENLSKAVDLYKMEDQMDLSKIIAAQALLKKMEKADLSQ
jgi:Flp pilus assembly protein TadD